MPLTLSLDAFFIYDKTEKKMFSAYEKNVPEEYFSKVLMCGHVRRELYVSPKGGVLPCMSMVETSMEEQFPNMLVTPLEEILDRGSLYMDVINYRISDFMAHNPECTECEYRTLCCGGCRALAQHDHPGDYLAKDEIICEYYKGGWHKKRAELLKSLGY